MNQYYRPRGFGQKFSMFPPVIKSILIINIAAQLILWLFGDLHFGSQASIYSFTREYLYLHPFEGTHYMGQEIGQFYIWQLITYQFLHDLTSIFHLFFNLFALWMFGAEIERMWGSSKFLIFYLLCGIGAGVLQMFISNGPTLGASGSVYGVLLAFALSFPDRQIFMFPLFIPIKAKWFVAIFIGIALISGMSNNPNDNVAHFAHLGGAATGFLLFKYGDKIGVYRFFDKIIRLFSKSDDSGDYTRKRTQDGATVYSVEWEEKKSAPRYKSEPKKSAMNVNGEEITQKTIDEILDKISANGYQSLTEREKQILFELSQKLK